MSDDSSPVGADHHTADPAFSQAAQFLERISDGFAVLDADGRLTHVNGKAAQIFGHPAEDLIGRHPWTELLDGGDQPLYDVWRRAMAAQTPQEIEEYHPTLDRWFHKRVFPSVGGATVFFLDVTERTRAEERLRESERRLVEAQRIARLGSWEWDLRTGAASWSEEMRRMVGWPDDAPAPEGEDAWGLVHPDDRARIKAQVQEAISRGSEIDFENRLRRPDGREILLRNWGHVVSDAAGRPLRLIAVAQDVTEQRRTEAALQESQGQLQAIAEATPASIVITRQSDGAVLYANPFARQLFGVDPDADLSGYHATDFYQDPTDRAETLRLLAQHPFVGPRELAVHRLDGRPVWAMGSFQRLTYRGEEVLLATHHDITERKLIEAEKERLLAEAQARADHDPLTDLLNHGAFQRRLADEAARAERESAPLAVVMLDMDNFKFFNDAYGHTVGDEVLRQVADRLHAVCRHEDVLARYGGDEFALLLPHVGDAPATEIEAQIRARMEGLTFRPPGQVTVIPISISAGAATFPFDGLPWQDVVGRADERLRRAKAGGPGETHVDQVRLSLLDSRDGFPMLDALVNAVDNKDRYTRRHSEDVLTYSLAIARELGLDDTEQQSVAVSALLHDVGKIGVPDAILRKPDALTEEEFAAIRRHPMMGAILVQAVPGLEDTLDAIRHHHERWDGRGYPHGLRGEETPLIARLMAVADAFSAMTTDRPYRAGLDDGQALSILEAGAGTQWDPQCVRSFLRARHAPL